MHLNIKSQICQKQKKKKGKDTNQTLEWLREYHTKWISEQGILAGKKEGPFTMIKKSIHQEGVTTVNV